MSPSVKIRIRGLFYNEKYHLYKKLRRSVLYFYSKHLYHSNNSSSSSSSCCSDCSSCSSSTVMFVSQNSFSSWTESSALGRPSQVRSDTHQPQPELHYNTETLSSAADNGIPVIQSHVSHLSKTIRPLPRVGRDPLAHTHRSQPRLPDPQKNNPLKNLLNHKKNTVRFVEINTRMDMVHL